MSAAACATNFLNPVKRSTNCFFQKDLWGSEETNKKIDGMETNEKSLNKHMHDRHAHYWVAQARRRLLASMLMSKVGDSDMTYNQATLFVDVPALMVQPRARAPSPAPSVPSPGLTTGPRKGVASLGIAVGG
jgi:hypothetical protein